MTGAFWAKRGERDISRGARDEREARDERSPRLARKAPVMQAIRFSAAVSGEEHCVTTLETAV